jgi:UDP-N-acetylmuramoyl-tripeptide--D-alanyl-D-alanine ligase
MVTFILSAFIFLFASLNVLKLIQIKEYFFPSLWSHFDYPSSYYIFFRRRELFLYLLWILFFLWGLQGYLLKPDQFPFDILFMPIIFIITLALLFRKLEFLKTFNWTPKFLFICALVFIINYQLLKISSNDLLIFISLSITATQFTFSIFSTYIANLITKVYAKNVLYKKAKKKIIDWKNKKEGREVIGITGSYAKSSTKEILAQLLSKKYKVLKSPERLNAEIGLSQFIIKSNLDDIDYIVLELGARQIGEIETLVEIFQPKIVFLTGLAPQHLATFGSFENIVLGKMEIFKKVVPDGIALLNGNDKFVREIFDDLTIPKKYLYSTEEGHFYSRGEIYSLDGTEFNFIYPREEIKLKTNLVGRSFLNNLVGALACAYLLGINIKDLEDEIKNIKLLKHSFEVVKKENPVIIDDSYNANLVGVEKGSEFFLEIPIKYRVLFFGGIIELGAETRDLYKDLINNFRKFDKVILTFKDFSDIFLDELGKKVEIYNNQTIYELIKEFPKEDLGIIIFGRIPEKLLYQIRSL